MVHFPPIAVSFDKQVDIGAMWSSYADGSRWAAEQSFQHFRTSTRTLWLLHCTALLHANVCVYVYISNVTAASSKDLEKCSLLVSIPRVFLVLRKSCARVMHLSSLRTASSTSLSNRALVKYLCFESCWNELCYHAMPEAAPTPDVSPSTSEPATAPSAAPQQQAARTMHERLGLRWSDPYEQTGASPMQVRLSLRAAIWC